MSHGFGQVGGGLAAEGTTAMDVPARAVSARDSTTKLRCAHCLHTIELPPEQVRSRIRCTQCRRRLRVPRHIKHPCPRCGCHGQYGPDSSGRYVNCCNCGSRMMLPPQMVRPRRRRRSDRPPREASAVSLVVSLTISLLAVFLCLKLL